MLLYCSSMSEAADGMPEVEPGARLLGVRPGGSKRADASAINDQDVGAMTEVEHIERAIVSDDDGAGLYDFAKSALAASRSRDEVANAIAAVRERLRETHRWEQRHEDKFIDVTDALYGWCHPSVNLCPPD